MIKFQFLKIILKSLKKKIPLVLYSSLGFFDGIMKMIMSLKSINLTYNVSERTAMSGIIDSPGLFGQNNVTNSPGWDFVFGSQDASVRKKSSS